jgi:hypothetical protein
MNSLKICIAVAIVITIIITITMYKWYKWYKLYRISPKHTAKKTHYYQKIDNLVSIPDTQSYVELKNLYYEGIPDKYDVNGTKIHGVPPNPDLAIYYLNMAIKNGYTQGWLELAQMYQHGFYNFPSNLDKAEELYTYIINNVDDYDIANQAYELYKETHGENQNISTYKWLNLPYTTYIKPKRTKYELSQVKNKMAAQKHVDFVPPVNTLNVNDIFRAGGQQKEAEVIEPAIKNDMHNVHDHSVIATIRASIEELKKTPITINDSQCFLEMRQYLNTLPSTDKTTDALAALDTVEKSYLPVSFIDLKEAEVLALVWNRIHSEVNKDNAKNLRENLVDELAECIEHGKPVCQTGRITRMVDTLNAVDPGVTIKPTFMIDQEMMDKAGHIRDDVYGKLSASEKNDVDSMTPNDFQKQWTQGLKDDIKQQLHNDYVKSDIMLESTFNQCIDKWINVL